MSILNINSKPAFHLSGMTLNNRWIVGKRRERKETQTGGIYSCCYDVLGSDGYPAFLKVYDYSDAHNKVSRDFAEVMKRITTAYLYELTLLETCRDHQLNNVVRLVDHGSCTVPGNFVDGRVEYLVLEHSQEGDTRNYMDRHNKLVNVSWKLRTMHQIAKAVSQLHRIGVAHQDIKPSNVLSYHKGMAKLTDLGSAYSLKPIVKEVPEHLELNYSGTYDYAPPELLYGYVSRDGQQRRLTCDLYLIGSMLVFYFTGMNMNAFLKEHLDRNLWWERPNVQGKFEEIKPFLIDAHFRALKSFKECVDDEYLAERLAPMLQYFCHPDPAERGHTKNKSQGYDKYGLARIITELNVLAKKYEFA